MNTPDQKQQGHQNQNQSRSLASQNNMAMPTQLMADQRPASVAQTKLQNLAATGAHAQQAAQLQDIANNSSVGQPQIPGCKSANSDLPAQLQTNLESMTGTSLAGTKVFHNSDKPAQLNAHAYAQNNEIHLGPGQEKHLPHEAAHLTQQAQGRVKATTQLKGKTPVNDDPALEKEADVLGAKAMSMAPTGAPAQMKSLSAGSNSSAPAQLMPIDEIEVNKRYYYMYLSHLTYDIGYGKVIRKEADRVVLESADGIENRVNPEDISTSRDEIAAKVQQMEQNDAQNNSAQSRLGQLGAEFMADLQKQKSTQGNNNANATESDSHFELERQGTQIRSASSFMSQKSLRQDTLTNLGYDAHDMGKQRSIFADPDAAPPVHAQQFRNQLYTNNDGVSGFRLGWGSGMHVVKIDGSFYLKKLVVTKGIHDFVNPAEVIKRFGAEAGKTENNKISYTFSTDPNSGAIRLDEMVTVSVSSCSFSIAADSDMENLLIMHINNGDDSNPHPLPLDELVSKSDAAKLGITTLFSSYINREVERQKVQKSADDYGITDLQTHEREYDDETPLGMAINANSSLESAGINFHGPNGPQANFDSGSREQRFGLLTGAAHNTHIAHKGYPGTKAERYERIVTGFKKYLGTQLFSAGEIEKIMAELKKLGSGSSDNEKIAKAIKIFKNSRNNKKFLETAAIIKDFLDYVVQTDLSDLLFGVQENDDNSPE